MKLAKYLADYLDYEHLLVRRNGGSDLDADDVQEILEQGIEAFESTEGVVVPVEAKDCPAVDIIASGYEWICPHCGELNKVIEHREICFCNKCGQSVSTNPPEHAYGS